jgi:hypothetical protein
MKNCGEFRSVLISIAREEPIDERARNAFWQHAASCSECCEKLQAQRALNVSLSELAHAPLTPPAHITAALNQAFREQQQTAGHGQFGAWRTAAVIAILAVAAMLVLIVRSQLRAPARPAAPVIIKTAKDIQPQTPAKAPSTTPATASPARSAEQIRRQPAKRQARHRQTPAPSPNPPAEFVALPYAEPLRDTQRVDVYRVRVPLAELAHYGLAVDGRSLALPVTADIAVGEDGVARAIRFVDYH